MMNLRNTLLTTALLLGLAFSSASAEVAAPKRSAAVSATAGPVSPKRSVVRQHYYRMLAKVRPLLFWVSRDNVGGARIGWLGDSSGSRGFELLIGSDPARAPRKINRWGYIAEELRGSHASTLGVMKQSNEDSIEEAKAKLRERKRRHACVQGYPRDVCQRAVDVRRADAPGGKRPDVSRR